MSCDPFSLPHRPRVGGAATDLRFGGYSALCKLRSRKKKRTPANKDLGLVVSRGWKYLVTLFIFRLAAVDSNVIANGVLAWGQILMKRWCQHVQFCGIARLQCPTNIDWLTSEKRIFYIDIFAPLSPDVKLIPLTSGFAR